MSVKKNSEQASTTGATKGFAPRTTVAEGQDIVGRMQAFSDSVERLSAGRRNPFNIVIERYTSPVEAVVEGRPTLLFGTNNYLGLNFHPDCVRAATDALNEYGTGSTASRVASGTNSLHVALEQELAAFHGARDAVVFSTGFLANLGTLSALAQEGDVIFVDAHSHASIFDACRLSGAKTVTFRHNDGKDLARVFDESEISPQKSIMVVESLYSVFGDLGDLGTLVPLAKRRGATVIVDEAHALGVYGGRGRGVLESLHLEDEADVIVGTFSKSVGVMGGYAVTRNPAFQAMRFRARPYMYTASLPAPVLASARESIRLIADGHDLRAALWKNARSLHAGLSALGLPLCAEPGPVGSIRMDGIRRGSEFWTALLERGIYVNALIPPATPSGEVVLRFSVSAAHTVEQIERAIDVFAEVLRALPANSVSTSGFTATAGVAGRK